jgi:hypothetical protein
VNAALVQEIAQAVSQIGATSASLNSASRAESLYEGFTFACVIEALTQLGAQFEVRDHNDNATQMLTFRTKPGLIYSPGFTFVLARIGVRELELHTDVRVLGRSGVLHELDVALIDRDEGVRCRQQGVLPRASKVRFLAECKFYGRTVPLNLGREFLGLSSEFTIRVKTMVSSADNENIRRLITSHKGTENFNVSPMNPDKVKMFVQWLAKELSQVLR